MARHQLGTAAIAAHEAIVRLCASDMRPRELLEQVAARVRSVVPYATAGWLLTDPGTLLTTGGFDENVSRDMFLGLLDNEMTEADFAKFSEIARLAYPVATLSEATRGELALSPRHRKIYTPGGFRDELRAAFRAGGACWGVACLSRHEQDSDFTSAEIDFVAGVSEHVGHGLRSGLLLEACEYAPAPGGPPGMVVLLDEDDTLEALSGEAERWLAELPEEGRELPSVVYAVARRARASAQLGSGPPAHARVRLPSGRWLLVHGTRLQATGDRRGRTAVILERARQAEIAPLILELHELTERERQVTQALVSGMAVDQIAQSLWISTHTVRDHIKAIFAKLGVNTRPELTAMLFYGREGPGDSGVLGGDSRFPPSEV